MLIHRIAAQLATAPEFRDIERALNLGQEATLGIAQSARPLAIAALYARRPRPTVVVVAGEEAADRLIRTLRTALDRDPELSASQLQALCEKFWQQAENYK